MTKRAFGLSTLCAACFMLPTLAAAADGPSFDCAKAGTAVEKAICARPDLARMDRALAAAYRADVAAASDAGRAALRDAQRQWNGFVGTLCGRPGAPLHEQPPSTEECVKTEYAARQEQLAHVTELRGGLTIRRLDVFALHKATSADDWAPGNGYVTLRGSYPQIDGPKTPGEEAFNSKFTAMAQDIVRTFSAQADDNADSETRYAVAGATPALISIELALSEYPHGAAHPQNTALDVNWLLREGRELAAGDIFVAGSGWKTALRDLCFRALKAREAAFVKTPDDVGDMPADPQRWVPGPKGLTVRFNPYDVAPYAEGNVEIQVSWRDLKPYLAATSPIPMAR